MNARRKSDFVSRLLVAVAISTALTNGCRSRGNPIQGESDIGPAGEPEQYSATVVRIVENGSNRETSVSREARSGEQRRQEWIEGGQNRALIWRPDLGTSFLLDLDRRTFVELNTGPGRMSGAQAGIDTRADASSAQDPLGPVDDQTVQAIDHYLDDTPPTRVETQVLPVAVIEGHQCGVFERRAFFPDGHVETTRRFIARDLSGLLIRVESEGEHGMPRVITERRDIRLDVAPEAFIVPADFKKVETLAP